MDAQRNGLVISAKAPRHKAGSYLHDGELRLAQRTIILSSTFAGFRYLEWSRLSTQEWCRALGSEIGSLTC